MAHQRMSQYAPERIEEQEGRLRAGYGRARAMVGDHPGYSALACFGIGLGVGAVVTLLLVPEKKHKPSYRSYKSYLPDGRHAEALAHQVRDTVCQVLPDALARYLKR